MACSADVSSDGDPLFASMCVLVMLPSGPSSMVMATFLPCDARGSASNVYQFCAILRLHDVAVVGVARAEGAVGNVNAAAVPFLTAMVDIASCTAGAPLFAFGVSGTGCGVLRRVGCRRTAGFTGSLRVRLCLHCNVRRLGRRHGLFLRRRLRRIGDMVLRQHSLFDRRSLRRQGDRRHHRGLHRAPADAKSCRPSHSFVPRMHASAEQRNQACHRDMQNDGSRSFPRPGF